NFVIENLAVGGFTTYRIQPTGYVPPARRPAPRQAHNITAALALAPDAIIVNLPSNDQSDSFTLAEQMDNYERVAQLAREAGALLWVTTTQPRNFDKPAQLQDLMDARDAIKARFSPHAIDFWTNIANADGTIHASYDSGDGVHLNDAGHGVLAQRVISCAIPQVILSSKPPTAVRD
ncbi:MAG TPA: SGNH/GDSL hydrolase family protein, partial [Polyangiaceae bacterium]